MEQYFSCHYYNTLPGSHIYAGSPLERLTEELRRISTLRGSTYASHDEVIRLPLDRQVLDDVERVAKIYNTSTLKFVVVVGIGGSNLGTKAVYDALRGQYDYLSDKNPKLIFLDTTSEPALRDLEVILKRTIHYKEEILVNLVSKSGTTTESIVNFELLMDALSSIDGVSERVVCTTDQGSALWKQAEARGYGLLAIPKVVGGRFSIFSSVGLFPLLLAGVDVADLRKGAQDMLALCVGPDSSMHHARRAAEILFAEMARGVSIINIFHFAPELESLGKWERQLIAESLGKEKDVSGSVVHAGITPIVSIGSTDLHSMAQLYFGGPRDKFTMLIGVDGISGTKVPEDGLLHGLIPGITNKSAGDIMAAIYQGVVRAYRKNALPFAEVRLKEISAYTLGAYLEWRMMTVIFLAALMHVNPYDQPNVEDYKEGMREILGGGSK